MRLKLSYRFNLYIAGILLLGVASLMYYDLRTNSNAVLLCEIGVSEAERLSKAVFDQLYNSMRFGGGAAENAVIIERFRQIKGIEEVNVVPGPALGLKANTARRDGDEFLATVLTGEMLQKIEEGRNGYSTAMFGIPIKVSKDCTRCHEGVPGDVAGAVVVKISLEGYSRILTGRTRDFMFWGGGILIIMSLAVLFTVQRRLLGPLEKLKAATSELASGNLGFKVDIETGDELEEVGVAFNDMATKLVTTTTRFDALDEKHSKLVEMAADAILLKDLETGRIEEVNPEAVVLTGYSREELLSMRTEDLHPAEKLDEYKTVFKRWRHDGKGYLHDASIKRKDGTTVSVEIAASVMELNGKDYVQEIWRDLSERKGFEKTIKKYISDLEETVKERTGKLNESLAELEDAYRRLQNSEQRLIQSAKLISLGEMGAGIAHELNSPLAGILGLTEVLLSRISTEDRNHHLLEKIKDAAVRSKYIILDMLTYSRPAKGAHTPIFVNETIRATLCIFISELKTSSVEIVEDFDPELPKVSGNKGQLMEVMLNIIKNARDAMNGRGKITISTRTAEVRGRSYSVVTISDTGPGVPDDVLDKIFDPFFTTKEKGGGLNIGLGLSISQSIAKEHGGWIDVENGKEGGAVFKLYLPVCEQIAAAGYQEKG